MTQDPHLPEMLSRELTRVDAPAFLWTRVRAALDQPAPKAGAKRFNPAWMITAGVVLALGLFLQMSQNSQSLDLHQYIEAVQDAPIATASLAIGRAPQNFEKVPPEGRQVSLAGYRVATERTTAIHGEPVKQVILTSGDNSVALFIASARLHLDAGQHTWVEDQLDGLKCQRLICPRVRTIQFPCSKQTCIVICKACSERVMSGFLADLGSQSLDFH